MPEESVIPKPPKKLNITLIITAIFVVLLLIGTGYYFLVLKTNNSTTNYQKTSTQSSTNTNKSADSSGPPLKLKSIGFNLDYYNPTTGKAGDFVFTKMDLSAQYNLLFADFGTQDPRSPGDPTKRNPQPTFILPLGTKVLSLVDGVVVNVEELYSGDDTIMVAKSADDLSYVYETEHIVNPVVKKGDKVIGGQVIGEVSTHDSDHHPGFGIVEIGILHGGNPPEHLCPFAYLDPSIKDDIQKKITAFHKAWEDYKGLPNLYDDEHSVSPGCFTTNPAGG